MTPVRVTPPAATPVTLAEAKAHLRVDHGDDDAQITALIQAATDHLDGWSGILGRALVTQTWRVDLDAYPLTRYLKLPIPPVQSVTSIVYSDAANAEQTFADDGYSLFSGAVVLANGASFPSVYARPDAVRVTFVAGWPMTEGTDEVPAAWTGPPAIKAAILLLVGRFYAHRGEMVAGNMMDDPAVSALIAPYRVWA